MKSLLMIIAMQLLLSAQGLPWYKSFDTAFNHAVKSDKPLMIYITQPGCGVCERMEKSVFVDQTVQNYFNKHYIGAKLNLNDKGLPENLKPFATPTFYIVNQDKVEVTDTVLGGKTLEGFMDYLEEGVDYYQLMKRHKPQ